MASTDTPDGAAVAADKPLAGRTIALSISDTPDLARLGLAADEDTRLLGAMLTPLVRSGARIAYGGRIKPPTARTNFTLEVSAQLAEAYRRSDIQSGKRPMIHYLRSHDAHGEGADELLHHALRLGASSEIRLLSDETLVATLLPSGKIVNVRVGSRTLRGLETGAQLAAIPELQPIFAQERANDLVGMRNVMSRDTDGRVILGGRVSGTVGGTSGITDEALAALGLGKPLLIIGGIGGASRDVGGQLGLVEADDLVERDDAEYVDKQGAASKTRYDGQLALVAARRAAFEERAKRDGVWALLRQLAISESHAEIGALIVTVLRQSCKSPVGAT